MQKATFEVQFIKKLSNTEADLKKCVAYKEACNTNKTYLKRYFLKIPSHPAFTCSKLTIETLEQGVKYVQS